MAFEDEFELLDAEPVIVKTPVQVASQRIDPQEVFDYLIEKGVPEYHAKGKVANIKSESSFRPDAIGDNGTSGGLFQHHKERFDALKKFAPDWKTNWKAQIDYALTEADTKNFLEKQFSSPEEASEWFTKNWERPIDADTKAIQRAKDVNIAGLPIDESLFQDLDAEPFFEDLDAVPVINTEETVTPVVENPEANIAPVAQGQEATPIAEPVSEVSPQSGGDVLPLSQDTSFGTLGFRSKEEPEEGTSAIGALGKSISETSSYITNSVSQFFGSSSRVASKDFTRFSEMNRKIRAKKTKTKADLAKLELNNKIMDDLMDQVKESTVLEDQAKQISKQLIANIPKKAEEDVKKANDFLTQEDWASAALKEPGKFFDALGTATAAQAGQTMVAILPGVGTGLLVSSETGRFEQDLQKYAKENDIELDQDIVDKRSVQFGVPSGTIGAFTDKLLVGSKKLPFVGKKIEELSLKGFKKAAMATAGLVGSTGLEVIEELTQDRYQKYLEGEVMGEQLQRLHKENPNDPKIEPLKNAIGKKVKEIGQGERETIILTILTAGLMGGPTRLPGIASGVAEGVQGQIDARQEQPVEQAQEAPQTEFESIEDIPVIDLDTVVEERSSTLIKTGFDLPQQRKYTGQELDNRLLEKGGQIPSGFELKEETAEGMIIGPTDETILENAPELLVGRKAKEAELLDTKIEEMNLDGKKVSELTSEEAAIVQRKVQLQEEIEALKNEHLIPLTQDEFAEEFDSAEAELVDDQQIVAETQAELADKEIIAEQEIEEIDLDTEIIEEKPVKEVATETIKNFDESKRADAIESLRVGNLRKGLSEEESVAQAEIILDQLTPELAETFIEALSIQKRSAESQRIRAEVDPLTGLENRNYLQSEGFLEGKDDFKDGGQIVVDVDNFKPFNNKYGLKVGDQVLSVVGGLLKKHFSGVGIATRLGGDEFYIRINEGTTDVDVSKANEAFREELATHSFGDGDKVGITAGFGNTFEEANHQEEAAKKAGKNRLFIGGKDAQEIQQNIGEATGVTSREPDRLRDSTVKPPVKEDSKKSKQVKEEPKRSSEIVPPKKKWKSKGTIRANAGFEKRPKKKFTDAFEGKDKGVVKKRLELIKDAFDKGEISEEVAVKKAEEIINNASTKTIAEVRKSANVPTELPPNIDFAVRGAKEGKSINKILQEMDKQRLEVEDAYQKVQEKIANLNKDDRRNIDIIGPLAEELNSLEEKLIKDEPLEKFDIGGTERVNKLESEVTDATFYRKRDINTVAMIAKLEKALVRKDITEENRKQAEILLIGLHEDLTQEKKLNEEETKAAQKEYRKALVNPRLDNVSDRLQRELDAIIIAGRKDETLSQKKKTTKAIEEKQLQMAKVELFNDPDMNLSLNEVEEIYEVQALIKSEKKAIRNLPKEKQPAAQVKIDAKEIRLSNLFKKVIDRHFEQKQKNTPEENHALMNLYPKGMDWGSQDGFLNIGAIVDSFNAETMRRAWDKISNSERRRANEFVGKDFRKTLGDYDVMKTASQVHIKSLTMKTTENERGVLMFMMESDISNNVKRIQELRKTNPEKAKKEAAILSNKIIPTIKEMGPKSKELKHTMRELLDNPVRMNEMRKIAKQIKDHNDNLWKLINKNIDTISDDQVKWYVAHIWGSKESKNVTEEDVVEFKKFMTENKSLKGRTFQTYREGMARGWQPRFFDIAQIMDVNTQAGLQISMNNAMLEMLKGKNKAQTSFMQPRSELTDKIGWVPATKMNLSVKALEDQAIHPDMQPILKTLFKDKRRGSFWTFFEALSGLMKKASLSVSFFHHVALGETGIATIGLRKTIKSATNLKAIFKAGKNGSYDLITEKWDSAKDFLQHGGQLGDVTDVQRDAVDKALEWGQNQFEKVHPTLGKPMQALRNVNTVWDRILWDYWHNTMKIEGYDALLASNLRKKEDVTEGEMTIIKQEVAQLVNDTFGGQNWKSLMTDPRMMQYSQAVLLSPDWTLSTARQFVSPLGLSSITKTPLGKEMRRKMGRRFWGQAFLKYFIPLQIMNAMFRIQDDEDEWEKSLANKEKQIAKEKLTLAETNYFEKFTSSTLAKSRMADQKKLIEELNAELKDLKSKKPSRFPKPGEWADLTMWGNSPGHKFDLFWGRNEDGTEQYRGIMKQFKDVPELFLLLKEPTGVEFDPFGTGQEDRTFREGAFAHKMLGKAAPIVQRAWLFTTGVAHSLNPEAFRAETGLTGFRNSELEKARQEGSVAFSTKLLSQMAGSFLPMATRNIVNTDWTPERPFKVFDPDFNILDLSTQRRKGASKYFIQKGVQRVMTTLEKKPGNAKALAGTLEDLRISSGRNNINYRLILAKAQEGVFNMGKREIKFLAKKKAQLDRKTEKTDKDLNDISHLEVQLENAYVNLKNLRVGVLGLRENLSSED